MEREPSGRIPVMPTAQISGGWRLKLSEQIILDSVLATGRGAGGGRRRVWSASHPR